MKAGAGFRRVTRALHGSGTMRRRLAKLCLSSALLLGVLGGAVGAQPLKVGSTPTGLPFTFLDTKTKDRKSVV